MFGLKTGAKVNNFHKLNNKSVENVYLCSEKISWYEIWRKPLFPLRHSVVRKFTKLFLNYYLYYRADYPRVLMAAYVEENHSEKHQGQVDGLGLQVFLVEEHSTAEETDDDAATTNH